MYDVIVVGARCAGSPTAMLLARKIADLLKNGPLSCDKLASSTGTHARSLYRVMRALASVGVFAEKEQGDFTLTPLAACLMSDVPDSIRAAAIMLGEEHYRAWGDILHSIRTGTSSFEHLYGMGLFQYYAQNPEPAKIFQKAMTSVSAIDNTAVTLGYDFSNIQKLVDVGGGHGSLIASILKSNPNMKGVLFDQLSVIEGAKHLLDNQGVSSRCELIGGDFFQSVPAGGDAYILRHILHDWDDERAIAILKHCHFPTGDAFQFNVVSVPLSKIDLPITNAISSSEYATPFTATVAFIPPGGGPTPHVHWWEDEWWWVLKGKLDWYIGDNVYDIGEIPGVNAPLEDNFSRVQLSTGELSYSNDKRLHGYRNNTDETSILIHFWRRLENTDGGIEQFFLDDEIGKLVESPSDALLPNNFFDLERLAKWQEKFPEYRATISSSFDEYLTKNALVEGLDPQKLKDNKAEELIALLRQIPQFRQTPQTRAVPEPSVTFGLFAFGGLFAISTLKRKNKRIRLGIVNLN